MRIRTNSIAERHYTSLSSYASKTQLEQFFPCLHLADIFSTPERSISLISWYSGDDRGAGQLVGFRVDAHPAARPFRRDPDHFDFDTSQLS